MGWRTIRSAWILKRWCDVTAPLLEIRDLHVDYRVRGWRRPPVHAVDGVSLHIAHGETVGLVGESGSGKSTIGRAMLGLVTPVSGSIVLDGVDLRDMSSSDRACALQVVFQDPYGSLNPSRTVGKTLVEPLEVTGCVSRAEADTVIRDLLRKVSLPADAVGRYPHSFSGGQRQRIALARALVPSPQLVICDEALSALDVVTQASMLALLRQLQRETGVALLFISHDLAVVAQLSRRVVVLYRGRVMEQGPVDVVHKTPLHPYTRALLAAVPIPDPAQQRARRERRHELVSTSTANAALPSEHGCPFAPRCPHAHEVCNDVPPRDSAAEGRIVACHLFDRESGHPGVATSAMTIAAPARL
jgi:oligopeptide/dipeptide ABC transporter ATP-binding protein